MADESRTNYYDTAFFQKPEALFKDEDRLKKAFKIIEKHPEGHLLDIGCGSGGISLILKETMPLMDLYGVDISQDAVCIANKRGLKAFQADLNSSKLPFHDNSFDLVFCGEVIEHIFDTDFLLDEANRVLKPGGTLILTTPNLAAWYNRGALLFGFQPSIAVSLQNPEVGKPMKKAFKKQSSGGSEAHIRFFTKGAIRDLLKIHRFEILSIQGSYYKEPTKQSRILRLMFLFDKFFGHFSGFGVDLVIEARKLS